MKLSLFMNVLLVSSLAFVAIGCGKDKKKKGGSDNQFCYNGYCSQLGSATPVTGGSAIAALQNYINAVETNQNILGAVAVTKQRYSCQSKDFLGINFLPYESCSYTQISLPVKYVIANQPRVQVNPDLANLLTPIGGYALGNVTQYGNIIQVDHYMGAETIQYTVELNRHAVSNPSVIKDTANKRIDSVIYPNF